jgi:tetratricopeptide (TPR) repeat protein
MRADLKSRHGAISTGLLSAGLLLLPLAFDPWYGIPDLLLKRLLIYAVVLGLGLAWITVASGGPTWQPRSGLVLPAVGYVLLGFLSLFWATTPFHGLVEATRLLVLALLFVAVQVLIRMDGLITVARCSTVGGAALAAIGVCQYLGLAFEWIPSVGMPSGTFAFRNLAASYLIGCLPLALLAIALESTAWRRLLWAGCAALMALFLLYTRTRGAWVGTGLALIIACVVALYHGPLRRTLALTFKGIFATRLLRLGLPLLACAWLVAAFLPSHTSPGVIQQFDEQKTSAATTAVSMLSVGSDRGRLDMWKHTLDMVWDHPLLGVGLDNWEFVYPLYDTGVEPGKITAASEPVRPHNDFLWILSELGLVGLGLYLWLLGAAWVAARRVFRSGEATKQLCALAALAGIVALLGHSFFSFPKEQPAPAALFWLHLGIVGVVSSRISTGQKRDSINTMLPVMAVAVVICAIVLTFRQVRFDEHFQKARLLASQSSWRSGAQQMALAIDQGAFDHRASFLQARYLQRAGLQPEAEQAYREALAVHPNYAHSHHNLGGTLAAQGRWGEAIESYTNALSLRPQYLEARTNLGYAYAAAGRLDEAETTFRDVLRQAPSSAVALGNLGAVYLKKGHTQHAIRCLKEAVRIRPEYGEAYSNLGYALEQAGDTAEAIKAYSRLLDLWHGDRRAGILDHIANLRTSLINGN